MEQIESLELNLSEEIDTDFTERFSRVFFSNESSGVSFTHDEIDRLAHPTPHFPINQKDLLELASSVQQRIPLIEHALVTQRAEHFEATPNKNLRENPKMT